MSLVDKTVPLPNGGDASSGKSCAADRGPAKHLFAGDWRKQDTSAASAGPQRKWAGNMPALSVLFTVAYELGGNGERSVRNSHRIIADPAGCVLQRGNDWVGSRIAAGCSRAVMGCGYVITVLDSCNRSGESGVRLPSGARYVISDNAQRRRSNRESAIVDDHVVVAQLVVRVNQGRNDHVISYRTAGIGNAGIDRRDIIAGFQTSDGPGKFRISIAVEPAGIHRGHYQSCCLSLRGHGTNQHGQHQGCEEQGYGFWSCTLAGRQSGGNVLQSVHYCLPMSQVRRQPAIFTANRETAFRAGLTPAGTKLLRILSPEE